jgi:hypothetical protein
MNNFKHFITPEQAREQGDTRDMALLKSLATGRANKCCNCDEDEWRFAGLGMCFSCVTGESDASDDYELIEC